MRRNSQNKSIQKRESETGTERYSEPEKTAHEFPSVQDKFSYKCRVPFKYRGEKISCINLRRATVGDSIAVEEATKGFGFHRKNAYYYSMLSGMSPEAFTSMDINDWLRFINEAGSFLGMGGLTQES